MIKRTPLNRFLSMVLCLCMVLSLLPGIPLVANAAETEIETYAAERYMTIYFRNDWNWTQIKLYFWGSKTDTNPGWPGKSMTYYGASGGKNYYSLQVPTDVTGFIISGIKDDGSGTRDQSPDIKSGWYNGITYYMFWNNGNQVKSFNIRDVFACKHPNQQTVAGYAATCTKDGLSDGKKCTDCGQMVTAQKVIPATGHKFVDEVCSVCGAEQYVEVYFRNDWKWSEVSLYYWNSESVDNGWPGEAMTFYDNDGEFDYYVMKVPTDVAGIIIDGLKDDGSGELDQSPDIKSGWYDGIVYYMHWDNGNKVSSLNIADVKFPCKHLTQETVSGHDATCTGDGLTDGIKCSDCGETIKKQEVIPALGHNWNAATCTCPKTCSVCGVTEGENLGHSYDNDCDADCNTCGEPREPGEHQYYYDCDTNCVVCGALTRPDAIHVSNMYPCCDGVCMYGCGTFMPATAEHTYDNDCDADCNICFMPREVSGHTYDNDCDADCNICGDVREPGEHQYYYDCDTNCVVCGELTRPDAIHVSNYHYPCRDGVCMYGCGLEMPATAEHTYNNDCDADCNICGDVRETGEHQYYYDCDTNCVLCGELTRPEAIHVSNYHYPCRDGVCMYGCGTFMPATAEHTYDNDCDADCNICFMPREVSGHSYDNDCDADCNICGDVRWVPGHSYDNDCDADCNICGDVREPGEHRYYYACDTNCVACGELTRPDAIHLSNSASCADGVCLYGCGTFMPATDGHKYECYYEQAPTCSQSGVYYYLCVQCGDAYEEYPSATGNHTYDNNCDANCNTCGQPREPGEHQYYYDCDTNCLVCGELTRPEAIHVSNNHPCRDGVCMYGCGTAMPATGEHQYYYACDTNCVACGELTRPDAIHVSDSASCTDGVCLYGCGTAMPATDGHKYECYYEIAPTCGQSGAYYYQCVQCGDSYEEYPSATGNHTYDNDCDDNCNTCGEPREPGEHQYYYDCDTDCRVCGGLTRPEAIHVSNARPCLDGVCLYGCGTAMPATDGHKYECFYEQAPTCSQSGAYYYQCVQCGDSYEEYPSATGNHTYDNACDANCNTCGDVRDVPGHTDADNSGRCDSCRILMQPAKICFATASLEGNIAINFYTLLSDEVIADPDNAYMQFTMANGPVIKVLVSEAVYGELNGETYYMFTCSVNAKEMADDVICQFFYEGGSTAEITYNVKEYGNYIINNNDDASAKAMAQAMLNYGAASQLHFGHNTDNLANAELGTPDYSNVTIEGFDAEAGQGTELAKLYSASLILKSETTLRFFFKVDSSVENFTVMLNGEALEVNVRSGLHYVDVVGIAAKDLDKAVTLTINDGTTTADVSFNPMSYCQGVLNDTTGAFDAEMKDLVAALYLYNQAAKEYFKEG